MPATMKNVQVYILEFSQYFRCEDDGKSDYKAAIETQVTQAVLSYRILLTKIYSSVWKGGGGMKTWNNNS
jgi:hypothetical protein